MFRDSERQESLRCDDESMDTWDAIRARRNVREYSDRPIPQQDLQRTLEAGRRAPSSQNWPTSNFVVVADRNQRQERSKVWQGAGNVAGSAAMIALIG